MDWWALLGCAGVGLLALGLVTYVDHASLLGSLCLGLGAILCITAPVRAEDALVLLPMLGVALILAGRMLRVPGVSEAAGVAIAVAGLAAVVGYVVVSG